MHAVTSLRSMARREARLTRAQRVASALGYELQVEDIGGGLETAVLTTPCRRMSFDQLRELERFLRGVEYWRTRLAEIGAAGRCAHGNA